MNDPNRLTLAAITYILEHEHEDYNAIALRKSPFQEISSKDLAKQIKGRQVAAKKWPFLLDYPQFRYGSVTNLEQSSSSITANFKARIVSGGKVADLTGGMGMDCFAFAEVCPHVTYIEKDETLFKKSAYNFSVLGKSLIDCQNTSAESFLESTEEHFDWIYLDPSRRITGNRKTSIDNYEPSIVELYDRLVQVADNVLVKLSPMQDIKACLEAISGIQKIYVVSIDNDVKELLLHFTKENAEDPMIEVHELGKAPFIYVKTIDEMASSSQTAEVGRYIYQPSPAIIKAGLHNAQANQYGLYKIHANTQFYTSDELSETYSGRIFQVVGNVKNKADMKRWLPEMKANVITKNYPQSPEQLKKKLKIKDGGDLYILAFTKYDEKKVALICERMQ